MSKNPVICAVDTVDVSAAEKLVSSVRQHIGAVKLGLEFFTANGAAGVKEITCDTPLFLDLKFHDIPNTVAGAVRATAGINAFMMTVHTAGGKAMLKEAVAAAKDLPNKPLIIGVTVLTSLDGNDLSEIGFNNNMASQVSRFADLAQSSGLHGVVCSPHEISMLRKQCGKDFKLIVPGIRPSGSNSGDQKRTMSPKEAIQRGADYLVIGRPITQAADPARAAEGIFSEVSAIG